MVVVVFIAVVTNYCSCCYSSINISNTVARIVVAAVAVVAAGMNVWAVARVGMIILEGAVAVMWV